MEPSFSSRFGYARWLKHLREGQAPTHAAIGDAIGGRTGQGVAKMGKAEKPPKDWEIHTPLATFLGVDELWLIRNVGEPPEPELWKVWLRYRRADPAGIRKTRTKAETAADKRSRRERTG